MKLWKKTLIFALIVLIVGLSVRFLITAKQTDYSGCELWFEQNNIVDVVPIGKIQDYWYYQTADSKLVKTKNPCITTEQAEKYVRLVENADNG